MREPPAGESGDIQQPQEPFLTGPPAGAGQRLKYAVALVTAALFAAILGALCLPGGEEPEAPSVPLAAEQRLLKDVSDRPFNAEVLSQIPLSRRDSQGRLTADSAAMPADVALADGDIFVLDTNNNRILELDGKGSLLQVLDAQKDPRLALQIPMAIDAHKDELYVANSGAGNVIVLDPKGSVDRVIAPEAPAAGHPLRPIGIAVAANGDIYLSDPDNHRVLHLDSDGRLLSTLGSGKRDSGEYGFNTPGGLSLDTEGNLYVVDMLNYAVKKYSPSGEFLLAVGEAGDTEGAFSRPKAVTVDASGRIFVSDTLLVAVQAFASDGTYAGFIGRQDSGDKRSGSLFLAPHGLKVVGDTLYVVDRFAGLFALRLGSQTRPSPR